MTYPISSIVAATKHRKPRPTGIIDINLETGDLTQFTSMTDVGGNITAAAAAALGNTLYGMQIVIPNNTTRYGTKSGLASTSGIARVRFYLDPNTLTMGNLENFYIAQLNDNSAVRIANLVMRYSAGFQIQATMVDDAAADQNTSSYAISDAPHCIEVLLVRAATNISADGYISLYIDDLLKQTVSGKDNYDRFNSWGSLNIGARTGIDAGTSGTFFIDEIVGNNTGEVIGS